MSKFRVGDRIRSRCGKGDGTVKGHSPVDGQAIVDRDDGMLDWWTIENIWDKIGEGAMNKYQDLKRRIKAVQGWDKEADDILGEMNVPYQIEVNSRNDDRRIVAWYMPEGNWLNKSLEYTSQCSKLTAFKSALLWLLDHSDIKKDIVGEEREAEYDGGRYKIKILGKI